MATAFVAELPSLGKTKSQGFKPWSIFHNLSLPFQIVGLQFKRLNKNEPDLIFHSELVPDDLDDLLLEGVDLDGELLRRTQVVERSTDQILATSLLSEPLQQQSKGS